MAGLQLRTYYLFMTSNSDVRKQGLLKAYAISLILISKAVEADAKWNFMQYAHGGYAQGLTVAGLLLMKILNSSYSSYLDIEQGKKAFSDVLVMLRKASVEDNDLRGRVSKILAQLWSVHRSSSLRREQEPSLRIKSRCGASLLHDSLWIWREEFGGQAAVHSNGANAASGPISRQQTSERESLSLTTSILQNVDLILYKNRVCRKTEDGLKFGAQKLLALIVMMWPPRM